MLHRQATHAGSPNAYPTAIDRLPVAVTLLGGIVLEGTVPLRRGGRWPR